MKHREIALITNTHPGEVFSADKLAFVLGDEFSKGGDNASVHPMRDEYASIYTGNRISWWQHALEIADLRLRERNVEEDKVARLWTENGKDVVTIHDGDILPGTLGYVRRENPHLVVVEAFVGRRKRPDREVEERLDFAKILDQTGWSSHLLDVSDVDSAQAKEILKPGLVGQIVDTLKKVFADKNDTATHYF